MIILKTDWRTKEIDTMQHDDGNFSRHTSCWSPKLWSLTYGQVSQGWDWGSNWVEIFQISAVGIRRVRTQAMYHWANIHYFSSAVELPKMGHQKIIWWLMLLPVKQVPVSSSKWSIFKVLITFEVGRWCRIEKAHAWRCHGRNISIGFGKSSSREPCKESSHNLVLEFPATLQGLT